MRTVSIIRFAILGLATIALLSGGGGQAEAGFIQLSSPSALNPADATAIYTGLDGAVIASPYSLAVGGNTLTFTTADNGDFVRADQGNSWQPGAFPNGTKLLVNVDPQSGLGSSVTITFATPVTEVGLEVQQNVPADTTFASTVSGTAPSLTGTVFVSSSGVNGNLGFIGFAATGGDKIASLTISSSDGNPADANQFAMGPLTIAVPEPSTLCMASCSVLGLLAHALLRRKRATA